MKLNSKMKNSTVIILFIILFLISIVVATAIGAVKVPYSTTIKIILNEMGLTNFNIENKSFISIIFYVRFPRVLVAALVGAALALCGAVMQGMFRNPMADPGLIGVSSGASLGAVIAIALNFTAASMYFMPIFAVLGSLTAAFVIYRLSSRNGKVPVLTLILAGIAVSTFIGALTSLILTQIADYKVKEYLFWSVGSLTGRRWEHVRLAAVPIIVCGGILISFARDLNVLLLGEEEAQSLGLNPYKARRRMLFFSSLTTAIAVCVSGNIGFVGLIVPHILRLIVGPDNRILLPLSALGGGIFLILCDLLARTVIMPAEIGVGIVTSLVGAPYFLYLLNRARKEGVTM